MYRVKFHGRKAGALGVTYGLESSVSVCPFDDLQACRAELYERFECVESIELVSVDEPDALKYASPDTVAECLEGVFGIPDLAARLWALAEDHLPPETETPEPFRASWWSSLSLEDQHNLAELVKADDEWS